MARDDLLLAPAGWDGRAGAVELDPAEGRHAAVVLRCRPGQPVILVDGLGHRATARVTSIRKTRVQLEVEAVTRTPRVPSGLTLALGILHTQAMDWAVQKAVELDVDRFMPVVTARSQGSLDRSRGRVEHWTRVAEQALKQCHRLWRMDVSQPIGFEDAIACGPWAFGDPDGRPPREISAEASRGLLIGPEGGLSEDEIGMLTEAGWPAVALGRHVLRAETAAVVGAALLLSRAAETGQC